MVASDEDPEDVYMNAPCALMSFDATGTVIKANATLAAWTNRSVKELVGARFRDLLTVGTLILYETSFAPALSLRGTVEEISLDLRTSDGSVVAVTAGASLVRDQAGGHLATRMAMLKLSDRRLYERQLVEARDRLRDAELATRSALATERETSVLREQFIAVLGHDLRNPLTSISAGARLLQNEQPAEKRRMLLEVIQGSVVRMGSLIDNVMDFARGRLGAGIPLELRPDVSLATLLEQVVTELRIGLPDRVIESDLRLPVAVRCDASRIGQLVSNLLGNALTHGSPEVPVRLDAYADGDRLTISVTNGGAPIAEQALQRLFQPFFRGDVRPSQQGLGLGLHIASEIAKAHDGAIEASSTVEETRFTFRMPLSEQRLGPSDGASRS